MAEPIRIDSHVHLFDTEAQGHFAKDAYDIWEYGDQDAVSFSALSGTVAEIETAMAEAGIARSVVVNLFLAGEERKAFAAALPAGLGEAERATRLADFEAGLAQGFTRYNRDACRVARAHPTLVPFVTMDVTILAAEAGAAHLTDLVENEGARGVKLHGPSQGFFMGDERLGPIYAACRDLGLAVIGHSGPDREAQGFAEPRAFGAALAAFPEVNIVLAHMGGATWDQALEIAKSHENAYFDCCEIIEWTRSPNGPSDEQLGQLIHEIGADRVMMGSDYPWYDLDHTVERVLELPVLSAEEKAGMLGANAARILGL